MPFVLTKGRERSGGELNIKTRQGPGGHTPVGRGRF